jgi:hypothetical protein
LFVLWLRLISRAQVVQPRLQRQEVLYVVTEETGQVVVAYYAGCMAQLAAKEAPVRLTKGAGR